MPDAYRVRVSARAEAQLIEIGRYVANVLASPQAAERLLDCLQSQIASLSVFPGRIPFDNEEIPGEMGIHKMTCRNFLICFIINEEKRSVEILSVLYGRRNQLQGLLDSLQS